jgi:hypothetical protein
MSENANEQTAGIISLESLMKKGSDGLFGLPEEDSNTDPANQLFLEKIVDEEDSSLKDKDNGEGDEPLDTGVEDTSKLDREKQTKAPEEKVGNQNHLHKILKNLYGDQTLTIIQEVDGEDVEVSVDELELDEELLAEIIRTKSEQEKEEVAKDKISIQGVTEFTKNLIEIDKRGGTVTDLLELRQNYIDPLEQLDTTTPEGQKAVIRLRMLAAGSSEEDIKDFVEVFEKKGELETKALKYEAEIREAVNARAEERKQKVLAAEEDRKERMKVYKQDLKQSIKESFELKDTEVNKLVDFATKYTQDQNDLAKTFTEALADPKRAAKLVLFLFDEKEFEAQINSKTLKDHQKNTGVRLGTIRAKGSSKPGFDLNKGGKEEDFFIPLS